MHHEIRLFFSSSVNFDGLIEVINNQISVIHGKKSSNRPVCLFSPSPTQVNGDKGVFRRILLMVTFFINFCRRTATRDFEGLRINATMGIINDTLKLSTVYFRFQ